jgi:uncharacterized membrane protein
MIASQRPSTPPMSVTSVPHSWPRLAHPAAGVKHRALAPVLAADGLSLCWTLSRNCAISPAQLGAVYASLCTLCLLIGAYFVWHGTAVVALFAVFELLAVGTAMLVFARHAADGERFTLAGRSLLVEQRVGPRTEQFVLSTEWLKIEPAAGQGSLVEISDRKQTLRVGRHLRPEWRGAFAHELRRAIRQPGTGLEPETNQN